MSHCGIKFYARGFLSVAAVLIGLIAGYILALRHGRCQLWQPRERGMVSPLPQPFAFGFEINWAIVIGMCLMAFVSAIETVGDTSGITKGGADREATDEGSLGRDLCGWPWHRYRRCLRRLAQYLVQPERRSVAMTGVMSRHVVTIGAIFLIRRWFSKSGAIINYVPINVLGGGVIVMFGMVCAAGINMLSDVNWNRRNMVIFAISLSIGLGLQQVPDAMAFLGGTMKILLTSGLLPAAIIAIVLNLILPEELGE